MPILFFAISIVLIVAPSEFARLVLHKRFYLGVTDLPSEHPRSDHVLDICLTAWYYALLLAIVWWCWRCARKQKRGSHHT